MANQTFIEIASKVYSKTAKREELASFVEVFNKIRARGATNPLVLWEINEIITKTADEILKPRLDFVERFSEVQRVDHGQKIEFEIPGKTKFAMQWTARGTTVDYQRVGHKRKFTSEPEKIQGGAYYEIDQLLAGNVDAFIGVIDALVKDMEDKLAGRVISTLHSAMATAPSANRWTGAGITQSNFDSVASVIQRYDRNVSCIGDIDFVKKIANFVGPEYMTEQMKELRNRNGYFGTVNGVDLTAFTNPFAEDDTDNTKLAAPRRFAYIVPAGAQKPIKIGFEGGLQQFTELDVQAERVFLKAGQKVGIDVFHDLRNIGELEDTTLA